MSYKILDCEDIFKFIITNLLSDNHNKKISYEKIENIRSQIIKKINQEDNKATIDAYKYFLYLFNQ
ncbi:MAG: hypothetical protein N2485_01755 [bacterium]|nr:hypothetical protein [bacterium]